MSGSDKAKGMKSAYELALERLEAQGIERPSETALSDETKRSIAEARRHTEAKLAELEILHRDKLKKLDDPTQLAEQDEFYRLEKARIESDGESRVAKLRSTP